MNGKSLFSRLNAAPYIVWSAIFVVVPILIMGYYALTSEDGTFSLANILSLGKFAKPFLISIVYAIIATILTLLFSYPLAYIMTRINIRAQRMMMILVMLPMWTNFLIRTYSWISILANTGIINTLLGKLGLGPLKLINTPGAVILGMIYDFFPYMVLPIYTVMSKIDKSLIDAAADLGASKLNAIKRVLFPLSLPGVVSGITMVFVPSVSTFYISQKLGGNKTMLIGDTIEYLFNLGPTYYNVASALSLVLMVMIIFCLIIMNRFSESDDGGMLL